MNKRFLLLMTVAGLLTAASCYKYPSNTDYLYETDVVLTNYDIHTNFSDLKTFSIPDSIGIITDNDTIPVQKKNDTTDALRNQIILNMEQNGYVKVDTNQDPDMAINVVAIKVINTVYVYPGYWWGYPGYPYYSDWYGYYYYYPWYPTVQYQYATGSLVIDVVDFKHANPKSKTLPIVFNAYIRGLLNGQHSMTQILKDIDQAFLQTPQFKTSN